ncbi:hypothetical protein HY641_05215 [Candidatus Woesearchaeota archaeon]|nr:hypothetical protein [Candidatus Woesearchaeota archaeon]
MAEKKYVSVSQVLENDISGSKRLIAYEFLSTKGKEEFKDCKTQYDRVKKIKELIDNGKDIDEYADNQEIDKTADQMILTGYPNPINWFHIVHETFQKPIESFYFWSLNSMGDLGYSRIIKVTDIFAASEASTMYGVTAQRLGLAQDKVAQYLATIGRLVKDLFQIVREIRIIKERLAYYKDAASDDSKKRNPAEIALKGMYVDLVEGGTKNPSSVLGLGSQVGFTPLPDLFFSVHPKTVEDISRLTSGDKWQFNAKLTEVLQRKLYQYVQWRDATKNELETREKHTLKYLRQHYDSIQLYLTWVKPYLKHIKRLTTQQTKSDSPHLVTAFESANIELEVIGTQMPKENSKYFICLLLNMKYRTTPTMSFQQDFQRGPIHMGYLDIMWRGYIWSQEDINRYLKMRDDENFELLSTINESIRDAMESLGDDLREYLSEAKEVFPEKIELKEGEKKEEDAISLKGLTEPFKGAFEIVKPVFGIKDAQTKKKGEQRARDETEKKNAFFGTFLLTYTASKLFKKANRFITW